MPAKTTRPWLEAYRLYRNSSASPWPLVILGDGDRREEVERTTTDMQLDGVTLAGWQPNKALPAYYAFAGAFVHTATVDPWGLVVNEAMATGLPVILSDGTGCHEDLVLDKGTGFVFPCGEPQIMADFMTRMAADAGERARMSARAKAVISEWTPARFGASIVDASVLADANVASGSIVAKSLVALIQKASTSQTSFHTVEN